MTVPPEPRGATAPDDVPAHRYDNRLAATIEARWQRAWEERGAYLAPNPVGDLAGPGAEPERPRAFVLDMFPYPSGSGLHVGHPLGYIGTDVHARFLRMNGHNVLHALGYDAFGLPAEQYAVQTGAHPRTTTEANIANIRAQLSRLGLGHDPRRSVSTIDPAYYRWTQWIFLQIYNSWYDPEADRARPIAELEARLAAGAVPTTCGRPWAELDAAARSAELNEHRLAYISEAPVNWCPGLGTVLANEEVTADGRSERGNFPVFRRSLRQWMMRITAYADRLLADLDILDWPERIRAQQRNWIGRSEGARVDFPLATGEGTITVFTTRPDTLWGATYMVLAPEHPLVDTLAADAWPEGVAAEWTGGAATPAAAVAAYRRAAARKSDVERQANAREKSGVFTGAHAINPTTGEPIPVFIADYVLMGYGTGAIMSVPAHDERDFAFARAFGLPIRCVVEPDDGRGLDPATWSEAHVAEGARVINSANAEVSLDGLPVARAKRVVTEWLSASGRGEGTVNFKLRDWLFSRQRYWGEPFPIVYDEDGVAHALPESMLPIELPEVDDYSPRTFAPEDADTDPESPLSRATEWTAVTLDLGDGPRRYRRETNTMPNWAGSCWYELRYLDPTNAALPVDPAIERYWMGPTEAKPAGGVDLYVGGAEHAVLHLLYARFWHKVLHDLGHVSSSEPFHRLVNQGMIQAYVYRDERGFPVPAAEVVVGEDGDYRHEGLPVSRKLGKMGKSLKNGVSPEEICEEYGADTLRLYEMAMGPLDVSRPWDTTSVVGPYRFLQRLWRNVIDEETGGLAVVDQEPDPATLRALHRTIDGVRADMEALRFNTAIAKATEFNNHLAKLPATPRPAAEALVLLIAPLAPHIAEELWRRLGHEESLVEADYPEADPRHLVAEATTYAVQVKGKLRATIDLPPDIAEEEAVARARELERVAAFIGDAPIRRTIFIRDRTINFVV